MKFLNVEKTLKYIFIYFKERSMNALLMQRLNAPEGFGGEVELSYSFLREPHLRTMQ